MAARALADSVAEGAPHVSVIVPVYNGGVAFERCLAALLASQGAPPWELLVVDDGSTDRSATQARAAGARVLSSPRPRGGPGAARNVGAAAARGALLCFIDADVAVAPDTLARVAGAFAAPDAPAALFGSYDDDPAEPDFLSQYKNLLHHYVHQTSRATATTFWAGCGAIRRAVFAELGGFATTYGRPAIEDIELGYRLTHAGYPIRLCHDLQVQHLKRWTPRVLLRTDLRDRAIPWTVLLLRERAVFGTATADLNLQATQRVSTVCVYLLWMALAGAVAAPRLALAAPPLAVGLVACNWPLYRFFLRRRGLGFLLRAIPWHWLYYTYGGLGFGLGVLAYLWERRAPRRGGRALVSGQ